MAEGHRRDEAIADAFGEDDDDDDAAAAAV